MFAHCRASLFLLGISSFLSQAFSQSLHNRRVDRNSIHFSYASDLLLHSRWQTKLETLTFTTTVKNIAHHQYLRHNDITMMSWHHYDAIAHNVNMMLLCFLLLICLANKKMSEKDESNFIERFTVRMPDGMRSAIAERAKRNGRSMNSEIVQILEDALSYDVSSVDKSLDLKQIKSLLDKISNELLDRIPKDT